MAELSITSYAKINLSLRILRQREDGYHDIETILQTIDLADHLNFTALETTDIQITVSGADVPTDESNLCFKAAILLREVGEAGKGCRIHIEKKIPLGAGLGGGSSNAAATLLALNQLWQLNLSDLQLFELAKQLGSDVPFFLRSGTALATGRGEILNYFESPWDYYVVVIYPEIQISSGWAYGNYKINLTNSKKDVKLDSYSLQQIQLHEFVEFFRNDFESVIFAHYPQLKKIKEELQNDAFYASLSGSGSAIYGLFEHKSDAEKAYYHFRRQYPTFLAKPVLDL